MRILDRYLARNLVWPLLFCLVFFFSLFIVIDAFNNLDEFLKHEASWHVIGSYYMFLLPAITVHIVPVATLVALLYGLGGLSRHNEISALKASGISRFQILSPYLFLGILLSFGVFLINEVLVPQSALTSTAIMDGLIKKGKDNFDERSLKNVTLYSKGNRMVFARELELLSGTLYDVIIMEEGPNQVIQNKTTAQKALFENGRWTLFGALSYRMNRRGDIVGDPVFKEKKDVDWRETPDDFIKEATEIEFMNTRQLKENITHLGGASPRLAHRLMVDLHSKIAFPFASFVVILLGAPLAMRVGRATALREIGVSLFIVILYYTVDATFLALGKGGYFSPVFSAWFANGAFTLTGLYLLNTGS